MAAKGLIYSRFANKKEKYIVDKIRPYDLQTIHIGIDYGASKSRTAFIAIGFTKGFKDLYVLKEKTTLGIKSPEEMYENFWKFYDDLVNRKGTKKIKKLGNFKLKGNWREIAKMRMKSLAVIKNFNIF